MLVLLGTGSLLALRQGGGAHAAGALPEWSARTAEAGVILQTLALTGGAVGLAWCGIEYMLGSEDAARRVRAKALMLLAATAAVFALPYFIRLGREAGLRWQWSPGSLG